MNDELKTVINNMIAHKADTQGTPDESWNDLTHDGQLEIQSDVFYLSMLIDDLLEYKVRHGDKFDIPNTVKVLRMDIVENHIN